MKKTTLFLGIAAMSAITATAATQEIDGLKFADVELGAPVNKMAVAEINKVQVVKAPMKISSVADVCGFYEYFCNDYAEKTTTSLAPVIYPNSGNEVIVTNVPFTDLYIDATVDVAGSTITLRKTDTGQYNSNYGENLMIGPFKWVPGEQDGYMNFQALDKLELTIAEDGTILFPIDEVGDYDYPTGIAIYVSGGFFYAYAGGNFTPLQFVDINLDEWKTYGKGVFTEPVLNSLIGAYATPIEPYEVDVMVNKENEGLYLIVDPYKGTRFDVPSIGLTNMSPNANGYIMIDASYPDCILVQPLVSSGFGYQVDEEGNWTDLYIFNMEAMMVRDGYTPEDVLYEYDGNDELCSRLEDDTMYLMHMRFAMSDNPLGIYTWKDITMKEGVLVLDKAGVEGIEADSNAPVKYFNLQGVEIANPEKGQLVIKKQGSNAKKMIVR